MCGLQVINGYRKTLPIPPFSEGVSKVASALVQLMRRRMLRSTADATLASPFAATLAAQWGLIAGTLAAFAKFC